MQMADREGWFTRVSDNQYTLFLQDAYRGGVCRIPDDRYRDFLMAYARDVASPETHIYLSEQRSLVYAMHFDIDGLMLTDEQRLALLRVIDKTLRCCYPKNTPEKTFLMYILDTSAADMREPKFKKPKTNLHIILPDMLVRNEEAEPMARECAQQANEILFKFGFKDFNDYFDYRLYSTNGLRLILSRKADPCELCRQNPSKVGFCTHCHGRKHFDAGRAYDVSHVFWRGEYSIPLLDSIKGNLAARVLACSIRREQGTEPTPGWRKNAGCPGSVTSSKEVQEARENLLNSNLSDLQVFRKLTAPQQQAKPAKKSPFQVDINPNTCEFNACLTTMRHFHPAYAQIQIQNIKTTVDRAVYCVQTKGTGSTTCQNLPLSQNDGQHHKSTIYFIITRAGIRQQCHSQKKENRIRGSCADFKTPVMPLDPATLQLLFPRSLKPGSLAPMAKEDQQLMLAKHICSRLSYFVRHPEALQKKPRKNKDNDRCEKRLADKKRSKVSVDD
jgi:hypothetical protein